MPTHNFEFCKVPEYPNKNACVYYYKMPVIDVRYSLNGSH